MVAGYWLLTFNGLVFMLEPGSLYHRETDVSADKPGRLRLQELCQSDVSSVHH